jgi:asparagine synthase (glutamine-hydrolysing)
MCGIAGILHSREKVSEVDLRRMAESIRHRGPDDQGFFISTQIGLAHNRLAILDLSSAGHQPMRAGDIIIVYNGEIYNYLELKDELVNRHNYQFSSETDTEVILAAYKTWGVECVQRLRGMWAFALWDEKLKQLLLSRDRFGIKPLYYAFDGIKLTFSSEIKALLASGISPVPDEPALADYLVIGYLDHRPETFFKNIVQLMPGYNAVYNAVTNQLHLHAYYDFESAVSSKASTFDQFHSTLKEALSIHLRSDVPVGVCLSGGLDSSSIAAIAGPLFRQSCGSPMTAITACSNDERDESAFAAQVVDAVNLDWIRTTPSCDDFKQLLTRIIWHQEQPTGSASVVMQYMVMKAARDHGIKVMLDGQGGDEILLGYERYYSSAFREWIKNGNILRFFREFYLAVMHSKLSWSDNLSYWIYFQSFTARRLLLRLKNRGLKPELIALAEQTLESSWSFENSAQSLQIRELKYYQLPHLLRFEDRSSMAHSIEARVPLVDHNVVEQAVALSLEWKIRNGYTKYALRCVAEKLLPSSIAWRRNKIGFEAPINKWTADCLDWMNQLVAESELIKSIYPARDARAPYSYRLFELAVWEEVFLQ